MEKSVEIFSYEPEFVGEESSGQEPINSQLREHETQVEGWVWGGHVRDFYRFYSLFNEYFFKGLLPVAVIKVERLRHDRPGSYHRERNAFGIKNEICINLDYHIGNRIFHLAVLLHQTLHIRQEAGECKGYHGKDFQIASEAVGVPVNSKGEITDIGEPFLSFVREHLSCTEDFYRYVHEIKEQLHFKTKRRGRSTSKKWSCGCQNCRVGTSDFRAVCLKCGREFVEL